MRQLYLTRVHKTMGGKDGLIYFFFRHPISWVWLCISSSKVGQRLRNKLLSVPSRRTRTQGSEVRGQWWQSRSKPLHWKTISRVRSCTVSACMWRWIIFTGLQNLDRYSMTYLDLLPMWTINSLDNKEQPPIKMRHKRQTAVKTIALVFARPTWQRESFIFPH